MPEDEQHLALISSISIWLPDAMQSTESETGKRSKRMAMPTIALNLHLPGKSLKVRFIGFLNDS
jgi:hypothetical protein